MTDVETLTGLTSRTGAFVVVRDTSDGPVEIGTARSLDEAVALIELRTAFGGATRPTVGLVIDAAPADMVRITDAEQLVFLAPVLDDASLQLVVAWEPQAPQDGSVGIFERAN